MAKKKKSKRRKGAGHRTNKSGRKGHANVDSATASGGVGHAASTAGQGSVSARPRPDTAQSSAGVTLQPFGTGPRFTVLMAAYNRADLIGTAIQSVLDQDFKEYELVIVDDGSTDQTPNVVRGFTDPRIRYIRKDVNEGRSPTRNRAIAEARGEYVLWMADDDLLMPGVLRLYDETLTAEPHIDVMYGHLQLFDHETGRDLNLFEPNDWTGQDQAIIGAKLYGSCVPDGGTANRRTLYAKVGSGPYDDEFVRAQDYELWTRIVGHARFRKVDATVYRYRKHAGGTSWGEFIDLSLDSKIIRRHVQRHPLPVLFAQLDWSFPEWATALAYIRIAKNLRMYGDHHNALRFLDGVPGVDVHPEAWTAKVQSMVAMGRLDEAASLVQAGRGDQLRPRETVASVEQLLADARALTTFATAARQDGRFNELGQRAQQFMSDHEQTYHAVLCRAYAEAGLGRHEKAMHNFCLAARLNPDDVEARDALVPLVDRFGESPKTDVDAMRRRVLERCSALPSSIQVPAPSSSTVTAIFWGGDSHRINDSTASVQASIAQLMAQDVNHLEVVIADDERHRTAIAAGQTWRNDHGLSPAHIQWVTSMIDEDPWAWYARASAHATGHYVTTVDPDSLMYPDHLARSLAILDGGADLVMCMGHYLKIDDRDPLRVSSSFYFPEAMYRDGDCQIQPHLSLSMFVHRRGADGVPAPSAVQGPMASWTYAVRLRKHRGLIRSAHPGIGRRMVEDRDADQSDLADLAQLYGRLGNDSAFDPVIREGQNARLAPLGFVQATQGRSTIVILINEPDATLKDCLAGLRASTWTPHDYLLVATHRDMVLPPWLAETIESRDDMRFSRAPQGAGLAKLLNVGLSNANGEYVVVMTAHLETLPGWLGRLQWAVGQSESPGLAMPLVIDAQSDPEWAISGRQAWLDGPTSPSAAAALDPRCFLCTRALLDAVGGFDTTLVHDAEMLTQFVNRVQQSGFGICRVHDVHCGQAFAQPPAIIPTQTGERGSNMGEVNRTLDVDELYISPGAEEGYRPDVHPLDVLEAGAENCLIYPPWDSEAQMTDLLEAVSVLPSGVVLWLRAEPGQGDPRMTWIEEWCARNRRSLAVDILVVDAHLAPEREGALYLRAGRVWTHETWPNARLTIRRAHDCGTIAMRGYDALHTWASQGVSSGEHSP
ncbi:MAG: glycosyltransferase family A protein [Myxococcota bacterium]|nr:glycosyltransferase family A protein [Myxococcota bacterium]